jgi:hypothetical protein
MFSHPVLDAGTPGRRAWLAGLASMLAAATVAVAMWRPAGPSRRCHHRDDSALVGSFGHGQGYGRGDGHGGGRAGGHGRHDRDASRPLAMLLVQVRSADLDLAHYLDADRPGGFPARVMPFADIDGRGTQTPHIDVSGDPRTWRWVGVAMDGPAAVALAHRLRELPAIADARAVYVLDDSRLSEGPKGPSESGKPGVHTFPRSESRPTRD